MSVYVLFFCQYKACRYIIIIIVVVVVVVVVKQPDNTWRA